MSIGIRRRDVLFSPVAFGSANLLAETMVKKGAEAYVDPVAMEAWMNTWMSARDPVGTLHMSRFKDRTYFLLKQIGWRPNPGGPKLPAVSVPKGFVTDFASIPRILWSILPPDGDYTYPSIIHDYLYWTQNTSRAIADEVFKSAMIDFKISSSEINSIYSGVRAGGQAAWNSNEKLRKSGERRILKKFPESPIISWAEWKTDKSNF